MQDNVTFGDGRLPDFLIIGGMKCGSTTLYDYLNEHPRVFMSKYKEPSYFSDDKVFCRGEDWYRSIFDQATPHQLCGEASTSYSRCEEYRFAVKPETWVNYLSAPSRIAAAIPDVRLIYIMRHPIERAYSHYSFLMQADAMMSFEKALMHHKTIIETSRYIDHIRRYLEHFSQEQLLLVILDDFEQDPEGELDRIQRFLGLEPMPLGRETIRSNPAGSAYAMERVNRWINAMRSQPILKAAIKKMAPEDLRRKIIARTSEALANGFLGRRLATRHKNKISAFSDESRAQLAEVLEQSTCELEEFLGRELPTWHQ